MRSLYLRGWISGAIESEPGRTERALVDEFAAKVLVVPCRDRWAEMEAAASAAADPVAIGERVRHKTKRMAAEQRRRTALRSGGPAAS